MLRLSFDYYTSAVRYTNYQRKTIFIDLGCGAGKTIIQPSESTGGHRLIESEVVYVFLSGVGQMEVIEYSNHEAGHGTNPSFGIEHKAELSIVSGDIVLAEEGDYIKVNNTSDQEQLT